MPPYKESPFKVVSSRIAWSCPWYQVRQDELVTPSGERAIYNVIDKGPAVWIVPVTPAYEVVMIYHYRHTVGAWCWEVPAGSVKPGQTLAEAAAAELREEVGGQATILTYIAPFFVASGTCSEPGHIFLATGVELGAAAREATEVMERHLKPLEEALRMAKRGEVQDGPSALALLLCAERLKV